MMALLRDEATCFGVCLACLLIRMHDPPNYTRGRDGSIYVYNRALVIQSKKYFCHTHGMVTRFEIIARIRLESSLGLIKCVLVRTTGGSHISAKMPPPKPSKKCVCTLPHVQMCIQVDARPSLSVWNLYVHYIHYNSSSHFYHSGKNAGAALLLRVGPKKRRMRTTMRVVEETGRLGWAHLVSCCICMYLSLIHI